MLRSSFPASVISGHANLQAEMLIYTGVVRSRQDLYRCVGAVNRRICESLPRTHRQLGTPAVDSGEPSASRSRPRDGAGQYTSSEFSRRMTPDVAGSASHQDSQALLIQMLFGRAASYVFLRMLSVLSRDDVSPVTFGSASSPSSSHSPHLACREARLNDVCAARSNSRHQRLEGAI